MVGGLHKYISGASEWMDVSFEQGDTVRQALGRVGVRPELLSTVLLDGERVSFDQTLKDGQQMTIIALMGGGIL